MPSTTRLSVYYKLFISTFEPLRGIEPPSSHYERDVLNRYTKRASKRSYLQILVPSSGLSSCSKVCVCTPPRIRTETEGILSPMPSSSWASGASELKDRIELSSHPYQGCVLNHYTIRAFVFPSRLELLSRT